MTGSLTMSTLLTVCPRHCGRDLVGRPRRDGVRRLRETNDASVLLFRCDFFAISMPYNKMRTHTHVADNKFNQRR